MCEPLAFDAKEDGAASTIAPTMRAQADSYAAWRLAALTSSAVLALCESCGGHPETGRAAGENVANTLGGGSAESQRGYRDDLDTSTYVTAGALQASGPPGTRRDDADVVGYIPDIAPARTARVSRGERQDVNEPSYVAIRTAQTGANGIGVAEDVTHTLDGAQQAIAVPLADTLSVGANQTTGFHGEVVAHTLRADGFDASEDGTGRGTPMVVGALMANAATERKHGDGGISAMDQYLAGHIQPTPNGMSVRRLTPTECSRLQGFPDNWLELDCAYGTEGETHAREILRGLWNQAREAAREGWRSRIAAALFTPEVLLAGVYGGWISWPLAYRCAEASRTSESAITWSEGFMSRLRGYSEGQTPSGREPFEQLARELGRSLPEMPLDEAQNAEILQRSELWSEAQAEWPLRPSFATRQAGRSTQLADGPRYRMLGNAVCVPVAEWISRRIMAADATQSKEQR